MQSKSNFVPAVRDKRIPSLPSQATHVIDVPVHATQHVQVETSATDRSKGFLIASLPLFVAFGISVVILSYQFANVPLFSFLSFLIFWSSFVLAWLFMYWLTLERSAEGVVHYEARQKWGVIKYEQRKRWEFYENHAAMLEDKG